MIRVLHQKDRTRCGDYCGITLVANTRKKFVKIVAVILVPHASPWDCYGMSSVDSARASVDHDHGVHGAQTAKASKECKSIVISTYRKLTTPSTPLY